MPSVGVGTIGYALLKAAEKGQMDCFEKLVPHSTGTSINAALSKLPDEHLEHPSVLKAVNNASRRSAYREVAKRATKIELLAHMLPFINILDVDGSFETACKGRKFFEITKHLFPFAENYIADACLESAVKESMEEHVTLLLPRVDRKKLVELSQSPDFRKLGNDSTRLQIESKAFRQRLPSSLHSCHRTKMTFVPPWKPNWKNTAPSRERTKLTWHAKINRAALTGWNGWIQQHWYFRSSEQHHGYCGKRKVARHWKSCCVLALPMLAQKPHSIFLSTKVKKLQKPVSRRR